MKKCANENGNPFDIAFEFANEFSKELSDTLSDKVCGLNGLIVADVLEMYATQIRQEKDISKDIAGNMLYAIYAAGKRIEAVSMTIPVNLDEGED